MSTYSKSKKINQTSVTVPVSDSNPTVVDYPNLTPRQVADHLISLGLSPLPVAPYSPDIRDKDGKEKFTGKNPSYLKANGHPETVTWSSYQTNQPTSYDLDLWFANPANGVGCLGLTNVIWLDFDVKDFDSQDDCDNQFTAWIDKYPQLKECWIESTGSGGYRLLIEVESTPDFTNFSLEPNGKHRGEALGFKKFAVLAPTKGTNPSQHKDYTIVTSIVKPIKVKSLESIGIYPHSAKSKKVSDKSKKVADKALEVKPTTTIKPLGNISLIECYTEQVKTIMLGGEFKDRSETFTKAVNEIQGWGNWLDSNGIGYTPSVSTEIDRAIEVIGIQDKADRVLDTIDLDSLQPACLSYPDGHISAWKKIRKLDREAYNVRCPYEIIDLIEKDIENYKKDSHKERIGWDKALSDLNTKQKSRETLTSKFAKNGFNLTDYHWRLLSLENEELAFNNVCESYGLSVLDKVSEKLAKKYAFNDCHELFKHVPEITDLAFCLGFYWQEYLKLEKKISYDTCAIYRVYGESLRFNTLRMQPEVNAIEHSIEDLKAEIEIIHRETLRSGKDEVISTFLTLAKKLSYNPVVEYLDECHRKGSNGINAESILTNYFKFNPKAMSPVKWKLYREYIERFLIGAVSRAYEPGCKLRTVLVLKGGQYIGKSMFFSILGGKWFDDTITMNSEKDDKLKMNRTWICEWQELESIIGKKAIGTVKNWIACGSDSVRPPYERSIKDMPRPSVICATVNEDTFLSDSTGETRFWVIDVGDNFLNLDWLKINRDSIWAYAVDLYKSGKLSWFNPDIPEDSELLKLQGQDNEEYATVDPWTECIEQGLASLDKVTTSVVMSWVEPDMSKQNKGTEKRVSAILKSLGWIRDNHQTREGNVRLRYFRPKTAKVLNEAVEF